MSYSVDQRSSRRKEINRHLTMARVLFFAILAMCLVCMLQSSPVETDAVTERNLMREAEAMITTAIENAKKTGESIANNPNVKAFFNDTAKAFQDGVTAIQQEVGKLIPKTN